MKYRTLLAATAGLALASCSSEPSEEAPVGDAPETAEPTPTEPVSIIRTDIEEAVMIPLEPLALTIGFGSGGSELDSDAVAALEGLIEARQLTEGGAITLRGHSDAGGRDAVNMRVSQDRAEAVRDWLVENGVAVDRITIIAFGEQNPVEPNALPDGEPNEPGMAANRRVEIEVEAPEGVMVEATPSPAATDMPGED